MWRTSVVAALALMSLPAEADSSATGRWISLFNGKDLTGWTAKIRGHGVGENFGDTFRVKGGLLQVAYDKYDNFGGRFGHLAYREPLSRYRLRLEYRFVGEQLAGGPGWALRNSGVMLHGQAPASMERDQDFPVSIEVQLLGAPGPKNAAGSSERPTANVCSPGTHIVMEGKLVTKHCNNSSSTTHHGDAWVRLEVEVDGGKLIRHLVNGQEVLRYSEPQLDDQDRHAQKLLAAGASKQLERGYIYLQSESHPVEFRKILLMRLPDRPER